ncbi:exonuclease domain-containing protein [Photobacterium nomapromontoriensis]|uniref:3'-5' exonuclease n=1 Tax=Photobacterium nomapromontoriensis TaxID=2910237 RepID=UPI003D0EF174
MKPISLENTVILDTETTGLYSDAEIVELTVLDGVTGKSLIDTLVTPVQLIPAEAIAIHGITNRMIAGSPIFPHVFKELAEVVKGREVLIYNADYDIRLIRQSMKRYGIEVLPFKTKCVMEWYAEFYGEWNGYHGNYKWQSLTNAARQQGIDISDLTAHRAKADCEITRRIIMAVNKQLEVQS